MLSIVFNNPVVVFWFTMLAAYMLGALLSVIILIIFKNNILMKSISRRIPEIKAEYEQAISESNLIIDTMSAEIGVYKRKQAEASLRASQLVKAIGG